MTHNRFSKKLTSRYSYDIELSDSHYTDMPTGALDVSRLLQHKSYWRAPIGKKRLQKKTLILPALPFLNKMSIHGVYIMNHRLEALSEAGFDVYHVCPDGLKAFPITLPDHQASSFSPDTTEDAQLAIAAALLDKSRDDLCLLNQAECELLSDESAESWHDFTSFDHLDLSFSKITVESFIQLLRDHAHEIKYLNLTGCNALVGVQLPSDIAFPHLETLILDVTLPKERFLTRWTPGHCKPYFSEASLKQILSTASQLTCLSLYGNKIIAGRKAVALEMSSDHITHLNLRDTLVPEQWLEAIFRKLIRPQQLILGNNRWFDASIHTTLDTSQLNELDLSQSEYTSAFVKRLIMNAPHLKILRLPPETDLAPLLPSLSFLSKLEEIYLKFSRVSIAMLEDLSCGATLKKLSLISCYDESEAAADSTLSFSALEEIALSDAKMTASALGQLLLSAPKLRKLSLKRHQSEITVLPEAILLTELEDLDFSCKDFTKLALARILSTAVKLKTLTVLCSPGVSVDLADQIQLVELEKLTLRSQKIDCSTFGTLLSHLPKLTYLDLDFCVTFIGTFGDQLRLNQLEKLSLNNTNISTPSLIELLSAAPKLKKCSLRNCFKLTDTPGDAPLALDQCRKISLSYFNELLLVKLISSAPNIQLLSFDDSLNPKERSRLIQMIPDPGRVRLFEEEEEVSITQQDTLQDVPTDHTRRSVRSHANHLSLDADTTHHPDLPGHATQLFYAATKRRDPPVTLYRLDVYSDFAVTTVPCAAGQAFTLQKHTAESQFQLIDLSPSTHDLKAHLTSMPDDQCFYGIQELMLTKAWQPIASLSAHEVLRQFKLTPLVDIQIAKSPQDNMHYIRIHPAALLPEAVVTFEFILEVPPSEPVSVLPTDIQQQIKACQAFKQNKLIIEPNATGHDYLAALTAQQTGACRHRSLVFFDWMKKNHPEIEVRYVTNDCHAFIEIGYQGKWVTCNLGGYPQTLVIDEFASAQSAADHADSIRTEISETGELVIKTRYFTEENRASSELLQQYPALYLGHVCSSKGSSQLITLDDNQRLADLVSHLERYCVETARPYFYVDAPEDLICSLPFIKRGEGDVGKMCKGPGGHLHHFLISLPDEGERAVLAINYDRFTPSDIVKFNALLDAARTADGTLLPARLRVIGLMHPNRPDAYHGTDFTSRFDAMNACPLLPDTLTLSPVTNEERVVHTELTRVIDLFGGDAWENDMLGCWVMHGEALHFREGALLQALREGCTHIDLKNVPWQNASFIRFWRSFLLKKSFEYEGRPYPLPDHFKLTKNTAPILKPTACLLAADVDELDDTPQLVLNPHVLSKYVGMYQCDAATRQLHHLPGILETRAGQTIRLHLTAALPPNAWTRLIAQCETYHVTVKLTLAEGVTLPPELALPIQAVQTEVIVWQNQAALPNTLFISSTDIDVTLSAFKHHDIIMIDVSDLSPADLLTKIEGQFNEDTCTFTFTERPSFLIKALSDNKTIILKGTLSEELRDHLAYFLMERQQDKQASGTLRIISDQENMFSMIATYQHRVSTQEKKALLTRVFDDAFIEKNSLSRLQAISRHLHVFPDAAPDDVWQAFDEVPSIAVDQQIDLSNAKRDAERVDQDRLNLVETALGDETPFVFLAGMTGVGKTTFMLDVWKAHHPHLHVGEKNIVAWARDGRPGFKTLFIDEANISSENWSVFEGLFLKPPRIFINGEYLTLTSDHKVIFAGNPLSYGGERQMPSLFARHANAVVFHPLPPAYLYQHILLPILGADASRSGKEEASEAGLGEAAVPILKVVQYLVSLSRDAVLITPREMAMMALMTKVFCQDNPGMDVSAVAKCYAYSFAHAFVPQDKKAAFDSQFKPEVYLPRHGLISPSDFVMTDSHLPAYHALIDYLMLRQSRQRDMTFPAGGLGGLILEGEPGLGKTELVMKTLAAQGLLKDCYHIPASMPPTEKKIKLLKAFHEGAVVVMDEINSAPMMERLLNDLLMGKDDEGNPAKHPGFMLIGTQNPATMAGRRRASSAMAHRCQTVVVQTPRREAMIEVVCYQGLPKEIAVSMVDEYLVFQKPKKLCFRDLVKVAKRHAEALSRMESGKEEADASLSKHGLFAGEVPLRASGAVSIKRRVD